MQTHCEFWVKKQKKEKEKNNKEVIQKKKKKKKPNFIKKKKKRELQKKKKIKKFKSLGRKREGNHGQYNRTKESGNKKELISGKVAQPHKIHLISLQKTNFWKQKRGNWCIEIHFH